MDKIAQWRNACLYTHDGRVEMNKIFCSVWINFVGSDGLWRWCITLRTTGALDFVHRLELETRKRRFGNWAVSVLRWREEDTCFHLILQGVLLLLVTANVVPSASILGTVMMEAIGSSETSVLTKATRRNILEDGILHSHRRENLKFYIALTDWAL
jgi:hypothetical protein